MLICKDILYLQTIWHYVPSKSKCGLLKRRQFLRLLYLLTVQRENVAGLIKTTGLVSEDEA